jgi:hypothetical protein
MRIKYSECTTLEHSINYAWRNLTPFIKVFLAKEFINYNFCFNQIFPSREDTLRYLPFYRAVSVNHFKVNHYFIIAALSVLDKTFREFLHAFVFNLFLSSFGGDVLHLVVPAR